MRQREAATVNRVKTILNSHGLYHVTFHGSHLTANGTPDILACGPDGRFIGIECKARTGKVSVVQWRRALEIIKSGGRVIIALDDLEGLFPKQEKVSQNDTEYTLYDRFNGLTASIELILDKSEGNKQ